jgi:hypothetical protein
MITAAVQDLQETDTGRGRKEMRMVGWREARSLAIVVAAGCLIGGVVVGSALAARIGRPAAAPKWLTFNAANQTAKLTLISGYQGVNAEYSFDGYAYGKMIVTIPEGWKVVVTCSTDNSAIVSHSCAITKKVDLTTPAFPHAQIPNPINGVVPGAASMFTFVASTAGKYFINCLVTGHATTGMWDVLRIAAGGTPSIRFK